ncbi:MAG: recombinase family protein [Mycobacteriales bacterium]
MKVALYARGADRDDQVGLLGTAARERGWEPVEAYADDGSAPLAVSPGWRALLAGAAAERFDFVLLDGWDRVGRSPEDLHGLLDELGSHGVAVSTLYRDFAVDTPAGTVTCQAGRTVPIPPVRGLNPGILCRTCTLRERC